jgi:predicted neutral ceramidase superfamily lipid hydrolase
MAGGFGHWYIMYWQFKMPNWIKSPIPYLLAIICTFLWIKASEYGVAGFNGSMWSNRFLFFITGIIVASMLYPYHFNQAFTSKTLVQLILAFTILLVSFLWK